MNIAISCDVTACSLATFTDLSEDHTSSIFRIEAQQVKKQATSSLVVCYTATLKIETVRSTEMSVNLF
jgi:hypothetical protein